MTDEEADDLLLSNDWAKHSDARELLKTAAHMGAMAERERCAALCIGVGAVISASATGVRRLAGMRAAESCARAIQSTPGTVVGVA